MSGSLHYEGKAVAELDIANQQEVSPAEAMYRVGRAQAFAMLAISASVRDAKR